MRSLLKSEIALFSRKNWLAALLWTIAILVPLWMYWQNFLHAPPELILLAIPLATANGFCEEMLWRGLYVRAFIGNPWLTIIYPSLGFALWHLAPQNIFPSENGAGFVLMTLALGLTYGYIAHATRSAKWTTIAHSLSGILALSGMLAPSLLELFSR